jgi:hypothetical protein
MQSGGIDIPAFTVTADFSGTIGNNVHISFGDSPQLTSIQTAIDNWNLANP